MIDCLFGALSSAVPDNVTADTTGGSTLPTISGYINGKAYVFCETFMGTGEVPVNMMGKKGYHIWGQTNRTFRSK